ncbi:MAG: S8 family serine peptidase [Ilumatobacteraceae bacterium]
MHHVSRRRFTVIAAVLAAAALPLAAMSPVSAQQNGPRRGQEEPPGASKSNSDHARHKLHPRLRAEVDSGSTEQVQVFATVAGTPAGATRYLTDEHVTFSDGAGLVVGTIGAQSLPKLAGAVGVVAVGPIDFAQTGEPIGDPDPQVAARPVAGPNSNALGALFRKEVPHSAAPAPRGSRFEQLRHLALLDAATHNFVEAWDAGFTGTGVTVGVLDGGTDFGHPDLLGTWQTWSGQTGARAGWNGWPKAFDPYGTLQWLAAPQLVDQGLSWYTRTTPTVCQGWAGKQQQSTCPVRFATRTGPSRNFSAPDGTNTHTYQFPAGLTRSGNVYMGSHPDDYLLALFGERVAFLVTDSTTPGVYDTVYVDLDDDHRFDDEKPVTKASPAAYRDMNGDGYTDLSGGLVYFISDGVTATPGGLNVFEDPADPFPVFGPGQLVAWSGDFDPGIGGHGTLTASNIVGQGVSHGRAPTFTDLPVDSYPGVVGGAPNAKLTPYGDIYFSFAFSTQFGYFLATRNGVDVTSNSYGSSDVDNDGWDAASQEADVIHNGRRTTPLFSSGNGAPGFGTEAPPSPSAGITVGASTQFGGTGWDSIASTAQIVDNDVMVWSNRGPGANATPGIDLVADGAYSAGDATLNTILDGRNAWETWGGTSRSTPVAAGATALVYQAWRAANGGTVPAGFYETAKDILKSSANDLGYDSFIQGAGSLDAGAAVRTARATRARVTPNEWRVGDYRGTEYSVFSHVIAPGGSDSQHFTLTGGGTWSVSDRQLVRTDSEMRTFTSKPIAAESVYNFNAPDYLIDLTATVAAHPDADLMVVRLNYPRGQFDNDDDYSQEQGWRLLTYDWTDVNGDGNLWTDTSADGVVDHTNLGTISNPDGNFDLDFNQSEMDRGEYVRLMYHRADANHLMNFVRDPAARMSDGLFLGLQHSVRSGEIPVTNFEIEIDWYQNVDWSWVSTPAQATGAFDVSINVPGGTPYGMYSGAVVLTNGDDSMVVPVAVAVAATVTPNAAGQIVGATRFGGPDVAAAQSDHLYNNGAVFGANDWGWRAESGDWRFYFMDVTSAPADGSLFLTRTQWAGTAPHTDIDTLLMGPSTNEFQLFGDSVFGGPNIIDTVGSSPNTNVGAGVWLFDTATGGATDFVAAEAQDGLHAVALHQVGWEGDDFFTPYTVTVGGASVVPSTVEVNTTADTGSFDVTFTSGLDLDGLVAEAFGLSQPSVTTETASQDDPNEPSSASVKRDVQISHAARLRVSTALDTDDIDLFVVRDANGDGAFTDDEIVASSTTGTANESVEIVRPADGAYQVWAQGWSVAGHPQFKLTIDAVQGTDLTVSGVPAGPVAAGAPVTLTVDFAKPMTAGQAYVGELLLGPSVAPTALSVPIEITRT